jgi:hypothetical protein
MTPKKFKRQLEVHEDIQRKMHGNGQSTPKPKGMQVGYIDQLNGW